MKKINHYSVLLSESINGLKINPTGTYVDMTLGLGGHSKEIIRRLEKGGTLIAIDQDEKAIEIAKKNLSDEINKTKAKVIFIKSNFEKIDTVLEELNIKGIDGFLYDLGTSFYQLTSPERGFSFKEDLIDMRMDLDQTFTALSVLNEYSEKELMKMFFDYGDIKFARDLAKEIISFRENKPFKDTGDLNSIIDRFKKRNGKSSINNIYQAIRIEVNDEIGVLEKSLEKAIKFLNLNGVMSIITFHSLEDRVVKNFFRKYRDLEKETQFEILKFYKTTKAVFPSKEEVFENLPSRSAKLRILTKIYEQDISNRD